MKLLSVENDTLDSDVQELFEQFVYSVDRVFGGEDGLEYALTGNYDLIIIESSLPKINGVEIIRILRRENISTPILLLMSDSDVSSRLSGFAAGADDCLSRPFYVPELLARAKALCRRKGEYLGDEIIMGDTVLNRNTREIVKDGRTVHLGGKEYEMMEMLAINQKQIISKSKFADKIWGYDSDAEYNNIEVYVSFLRKKLRLLGSTVRIRSVRGIGYCLQW